ncbi:DUF4352 domain-containing protein [Companilactobacillus sp.]|jgi:cytoskeletal protein RodZ|uniref:DUF4352 domain-containing protein n=1 Tax=Companilactobacillus sp. TaxID=2767905 RepID=UPI0025BDA068|nr:DUF4352 domain-containing protein [Companilactobacillus sp.]MCH4009772.1 DUF4352 domain-containing protein [Companilactobacillus sp.]MCH4052552.1 DUF4352 domain-containing protein [Companilactobacillus sp.]MCH4077714.1 DUF4352 domain-containing protein [Companilactobacillus sp.]MCH4126290.1 DUF4352 domain-containing protein [Companilactobacillus sp.]MCI1311998.1 DUF4352 domain-containing protein [Companilactobacillus sp.]
MDTRRSRQSRNSRKHSQRKPPFYKDVWFWLFIVAVLFLFVPVIVPGSSDDTGTGHTKISQTASSKPSTKSDDADDSSDSGDDSDYDSDDSDEDTSSDTGKTSFGESMEFQSGEKVTVESAEDDNSIELLDAKDGEHPVAVKVTVENTKSSPLDFNPNSFDLYDSQNEIAELNAETYDNNIPDSIAAGKQATMVFYYGAKGSGPYSVTFGNATWE